MASKPSGKPNYRPKTKIVYVEKPVQKSKRRNNQSNRNGNYLSQNLKNYIQQTAAQVQTVPNMSADMQAGNLYNLSTISNQPFYNKNPYQVQRILESGSQAAITDGMYTIPQGGQAQMDYQTSLLARLGEKFLRKNAKTFGTFNKMNPQQSITQLRIALLDDPDVQPQDRQNPTFWSRLWDVIQQMAPTLIPIALQAGKAMFNPTAGHLEEVSSGTMELAKSVRDDRKDYISGTDSYHYNAINAGFVNCVLNPDFYFSRQPGLGWKSSAIRSSMEIPLYVNTNGEGAMYIFPQNLMNKLTGEFLTAFNTSLTGTNDYGAQPQMALAARMWDASFSAQAGTQGTGTTTALCRLAEPVLSNIAAQSLTTTTTSPAQFFERVIINSMSMEFKPNISLTQSQGLVQIVQWNGPPADFFMRRTDVPYAPTDNAVGETTVLYSGSGVPILTQDQLPLQPMYQVESLLNAKLRYAKLFDGQNAVTSLYQSQPITKTTAGTLTTGTAIVFQPTFNTPFMGTSSGMYILVTGALTGTAKLKVGSVIISYAAEGSATSTLLPISPPEMALPGPATISAIRNLCLEYPEILQLKGEELHQLSIVVADCKNHDQLLCAVNSYFKGKSRIGSRVLVHNPQASIDPIVNQPDFYINLDQASVNSYDYMS